jgi:hypothetical protein
LGDTPKSRGFRDRKSPCPAAAGFFDSLLTPRFLAIIAARGAAWPAPRVWLRADPKPTGVDASAHFPQARDWGGDGSDLRGQIIHTAIPDFFLSFSQPVHFPPGGLQGEMVTLLRTFGHAVFFLFHSSEISIFAANH